MQCIVSDCLGVVRRVKQLCIDASPDFRTVTNLDDVIENIHTKFVENGHVAVVHWVNSHLTPKEYAPLSNWKEYLANGVADSLCGHAANVYQLDIRHSEKSS